MAAAPINTTALYLPGSHLTVYLEGLEETFKAQVASVELDALDMIESTIIDLFSNDRPDFIPLRIHLIKEVF